MAVTTVVFDVGETLVDEARYAASGDPRRAFSTEDIHPDALACLAVLRERGLRLGAAGNMRAVHEAFLHEHVDAVGSSESWDAWKPAPAFFAHVAAMMRAEPSEIVYVGDRVDNDVVPALAFGMSAVRIRRGAHADIESPAGTTVIHSLAELPDVLP